MFQHVLSKVVLYLVFLICDILFGCEDKRRIWLMIKSHLWWPFLCFRKTVNIWVHAHKDNIFFLRNSARIYIQNQGSGRHILEQFFEVKQKSQSKGGTPFPPLSQLHPCQLHVNYLHVGAIDTKSNHWPSKEKEKLTISGKFSLFLQYYQPQVNPEL